MHLFLTRLDKLWQVLKSPELRRILVRHRVLAGCEHRQVLRSNPAMVVDIGANRGQFSLAVRRWAPGARVLAFEPLAGPAAVFQAVFKGDCRVRLLRTAIGPETKEASIHVAAAVDSSSLLTASGLQKRIFPGTGEVRSEVVRVGRLSDFIVAEEIPAPALLKLDVQGFELEALKGCEDLLDRFGQVYVECSFMELYIGQASADEVTVWLRERGFKLAGVYNMSYDRNGAAVQGDFLFSAANR